jgi:hypothetical protein
VADSEACHKVRAVPGILFRVNCQTTKFVVPTPDSYYACASTNDSRVIIECFRNGFEISFHPILHFRSHLPFFLLMGTFKPEISHKKLKKNPCEKKTLM